MKLGYSILSTVILFSIAGTRVYAAACCVTSSSMPALITEYARAQTALSTAYSSAIGTSSSSGSSLFFGDERDENVFKTRVSQALTVSDRWQIHASFEILRRSKRLSNQREKSWALGDTTVGASYELVPEFTYHLIRPRVFLIATAITPTGKSIADDTSLLATSASGTGSWGFSGSLHALKTWTRWDLVFTAQHTRYLSQKRTIGRREVRYRPGALTVLDIGGGAHTSLFNVPTRLGLSTGPEWQATPLRRLVWNTEASLAVTPTQNWSTTLSYLDQTLLGPTYNSTLQRSIRLLLSKRFGG